MPSQTALNDYLSSDPATPRKTSPSYKSKNDNGNDESATPATPTRMPPGLGGTPNSAPAAVAGGRARANSKKMEPTLLTDFLLGKQSPARIAAERKRRQSIEAVKAEMREEMRQSAVRKLQPPGGVKSRVQQWQKANAAVIVDSAADEVATEPSDVAFKDDDVDSVTEEDRVRIKMRMKRRTAPARTRPPVGLHSSEAISSSHSGDAGGTSTVPPKKRVVSDDHWVKPKVRKYPSRRISPKSRKSISPNRLPRDFVQRSGPNASVPSKVKAWADNVEAPDEPSPRGYRLSKSMDRTSRHGDSDVQSEMDDSSSQATARHSVKLRPKSMGDDGIRVRPMRKKKLDDDGIRVSPVASTTTETDDGIRVRPITSIPAGSVAEQPRSSQNERQIRKARLSMRRESSPSNGAGTTAISSVTSWNSAGSREQGSEKTVATGEQDSALDTPTRRSGSRLQPGSKPRVKALQSEVTKLSDESSVLSEETSSLSGTCKLESDISSSIANKSLADIPGDIPFGQSAFSELDSPLNGASRRKLKRNKADRSTSLRAMPSVFKKVVEEGKKIIQDMNEPPRQPVANAPPSIEKWLNTTVDPFVDTPAKKPSEKDTATPKSKPAESELSHDTTADERSSYITDDSSTSHQHSVVKDEAEKDSRHDGTSKANTPKSDAETPRPKENKSSSPGGLKRSRATRSNSSPLKPTGRRQFLGVLKEAFQGESAGHTRPIIKSYESQEERRLEYDPLDRYPESQVTSSYFTDETGSTLTSDASELMESTTPKMASPRLRPPTNGHHALSTILSEDSSSAVDSDLQSDFTHSTLTQSTVLTRDSDASRPERKGSGLKRRLTKHSDLVSVLSLPDDRNVPERIQSNRSRPSQRKARRMSADVTGNDLLREFTDDESLYLKELKTLVDGVVPVLLSQVLNSSNVTDLFGADAATEKTASLSRSVVNMGVALEKLNHAHKKAPASDLRKLVHWAHGVVPIYHTYLKVWRLGFEDLVVNLAPRSDAPDDEDSLLNALPRNDKGDIVNADGERVAVAYLLKRPLVRVKQMTKLLKCVDSMMPSEDTNELLRDFEELQDKTRRRHKEETARITDEDATNTDTSRCRDPRTLNATGPVSIDPSRQVNAKDLFSLNLTHSNGQRLECQVELVHRDNLSQPNDAGDLLIRESGNSKQKYLLFPPISMSDISARTGDGNFDMVVMLRGGYRGHQWHELLTLFADNEDQILDWLDILPLSPVPPKEREPSILGVPDSHPASPRRWPEVPVGAQSLQIQTPSSPMASASSPRSPNSIPRRAVAQPSNDDAPSTPTRSTTPRSLSPQTTPTQDSYKDEGRSRPLRESLRPDPRQLQEQEQVSLSESYREDGAPPPPAHKTFSPSSPQPGEKSGLSLDPPVNLKNKEGLKRRTSSPLKHEYLPSDVSSSSESYSTDESDSASDSSDDEIESLDIPETELGVSIKKDNHAALDAVAAPPPIDSLVSTSDCSLTPSNSASQAGLYGPKVTPEDNATRFMASISRWSDKGMWKDVYNAPCSIIITAGLIEAYAFRSTAQQNTAGDDGRPVVALDLTPLVLIRQSTALDLEIRSSVQPHCKLHASHSGGNFRFRCHSAPECFNLYMSVHHARLNNQKFIQLENEARFRSFGERGPPAENDDDTSSRRRRSWFGRKNSYRSSVRAPAQSQDGGSSTPSSNQSASSFLKRLTVGGNISFNIARSSVDRNSSRSGGNSLYTSGSSSSGTPPRSPSISVENSGHSPASLDNENLRIRLHLLVTSSKWEDFGNCILQIRRPPPGWRQELRANHGLEKRITVTTMPRKDADEPKILLDAVLGSGCFSPMGSRGIVCGVWEELKDGNGAVGMVPATGATGGNIKKWCFQCATAGAANWVLRLVHQEVLRA